MKKETIIKIVCYVIAIGVICGLVLYKSNKKQSQSNVQSSQSYLSTSSSTNSGTLYSNGKTKNKVDESYREFYRLKESPAIDQSRLAALKFRQTRDTLLYWISVREEELEKDMEQAEAKGDNVAVERCKEELENLYRKKEEANSARPTHNEDDYE